MADIIEIIASGSGKLDHKTGEYEKKYAIIGTSSDAIVRAKVLAGSPTSYGGFPRATISFSPKDHNVWEATVTYSRQEKEREQPQYNFNTTGATTHITHALETVDSYECEQGLGTPDFKDAINVTKDDIKGIDVVVPTLTFSETHKFLPTKITTDFIRGLMDNTGKTNSKEFRKFKAGEVLFTGCSGQYADDRVAITYNFTCSKNLTDLEVAGATSVDKKGHDYMWVYFEDQEDSYTEDVVKGPRAVYVNRIYDSFDFKDLGITKFPPEKRREKEDENNPEGGGENGDD